MDITKIPSEIKIDFDGMIKEAVAGLTPKGLIKYINGACNTAFLLDSKVDMLSTEINWDDEKLIADFAFKVTDTRGVTEDVLIHHEVQSDLDSDMASRISNYNRNLEKKHGESLNGNVLIENYPLSVVIYICGGDSIPDEYIIEKRFKNAEPVDCIRVHVPVLSFNRLDATAVVERSLIPMGIFYAVSIRNKLNSIVPHRVKEISEKLAAETNVIIDGIQEAEENGDISRECAIKFTKFMRDVTEYILSRSNTTPEERKVIMLTMEQHVPRIVTWNPEYYKAEGKLEGKQEGIEEIIRNMLSMHLTIEQISQYTNMPLADVKRLVEKI